MSADTQPGGAEHPDNTPRNPTVWEEYLSRVELELCGAGFTVEQAGQIVDDGLDWREALKLVERGCPPEIAFDLVT